MHPGNPARSREVIPNDCRCLATNAVLRARVRHLEFSPNPPLASKPQLHASSHFTHTFQMKHLITAIALVFAGSSFAQATTAVKEAGKATAETSKQATENVKSATTKKPASTTHSAKASAHKSKAQHHGTQSKAAAKEAVK